MDSYILSASYSSDLLDMISKYAVESAYAFFHQKWRIYQYSTIDWQRDDIEYAIEDYVSRMDIELYEWLANGRNEFLCNHSDFAEDLECAVNLLETRLSEFSI